MDSKNKLQLINSLKNDDQDIIKKAINHVKDPNFTDQNGYTPLIYAVLYSSDEVMEILLKKGANPNYQNTQEQNDAGQSLLHYAVKAKRIKALNLLLRYKADANAVDIKARNPLHIASRLGFSEGVKILIDHVKDINALTVFNTTPLHYACETGNLEITAMLMENGAKVDYPGEDLKTPFYWALYNMHLDVAQSLLKFKPRTNELNLSDFHKNILLSRAIDGLDLANMDDVDIFNRSPLFYAYKLNDRLAVEFLLKNNCNRDIVDVYECKADYYLA